MGYAKIKNLYQETDILMLKEVYCLEKIHGTSSHISFSNNTLRFFAGGVGQDEFESLFNKEELLQKFNEVYHNDLPITIFGEAYGGKCQKMSDTYGKQLKFIAFEVKIGNSWLSVPQAEELIHSLGLDFVFYVKTSTDLEALNFERDRDSVQAIRNGMGEGHPSEGIVIRPLIELTKNNGERLIAKYKKEKFRETKSPRPVNAEKLEVLKNAQSIAEEWVTAERLNHVIDSIHVNIDTCNIPSIIRGMLEDIRLESTGEIEWNKEVDRAIGTATAKLVKNVCQQNLRV